MKKTIFLGLVGLSVAGLALLAGLGSAGGGGAAASQSAAATTGLLSGRNVNMVSGTKLPFGDPWLQRQNEPSLAASTRNPLHLFAGANDYRTIDVPDDFKLPGIEGTNAADAWLGVYESFDGGESWITTLLPGFPQDLSSEGQTSPLKAYETACDPIVRAGANGLFYYCGIAFNRSTNASALFVARYVDNNNLEKVEMRTDQDGANKYFGPIRYLDTRLVATGSTATSFIDMPNMAVDVPRRGALYGRVHVAYTVFSETGNSSVADKIYYQCSKDGGVTWSTPPVQLSLAGEVVQRPVIAVDPTDLRGDTLYVAFRRFAKGTVRDGIVVAKSTNGGLSFSRLPDVAPSFYPFDQATNANPASFRTNSYPTMVVGDLGTVYVAWSQRQGGPDGQARIMISALSKGGAVWTAPQVVDPTYAGIGHQFMPSLTFAAWKLMLAWYDQRQDQALDASPYIQDAPNGTRHTIDIRTAEGRPGVPPVFQPSVQVSRYLHVLDLDASGNPVEEGGYYKVVQAEANFANYPIFQLGKVPFHGDYLEITPSVRFLPPALALGSWIYNINPLEPTSFHAAWTDNRDVRPPNGNPWGNWVNYNPPVSVQDPDWPAPAPPPCLDGSSAGMRNQNVYTAHLNKGLIMGSPGNTKQLDLPLTGEGGRTFVVFVKNTTALERTLNLVLLQIGGVNASFDQFRDDDNIQVDLPPYSSSSCTVYVDRSTKPLAAVTVNAFEGLRLVGYVVLNPDPTNLPLNDPDNPFAELGQETHDPAVSAPEVWNYDLDGTSDPDPSALLNPRVQNPRVQNDSIVNPRVQNESVLNPRVQNESIVNSEVPNPRVQNTAVPNGALTDVTWTVTNEGNTTSVFTADVRSQYPEYFEGQNPPLLAQVLVYKVHRVPVDKNCRLYETHQDELIANVSNPRVQNPRVQNSPPAAATSALSAPLATQAADLGGQDITFYLAPHEQAAVTFRVWDADTTDGSPVFSPAQVITEVSAQAVDTADVASGNLVPSYAVPPNAVPWTDAPPAIGYVPGSIVISIPAGAEAVDRALTVWNAGGSILSFSVTDDAPWIEVTPSAGSSASQGYQNTLQVALSTAGLAVGPHAATITVTAPDAVNNPVRIPVLVTVEPNTLPPANEWTARYTARDINGNVLPDTEDVPAKAAVDSAGNVFVAGSSGPPGDKNIKVVKYDPYGQRHWEVTVTGFTGPNPGYNIANDLAVDAEGSVYVVGSSQGGGDYDFIVFKYTSQGELRWASRYGSGPGLQDQGRAIALDAAGNVYVAGWAQGDQTGYDYAIVQFRQNGELGWFQRYNGSGGTDDLVEDIAVDAAGNVIVTGTSYENGSENDITTVKYASDGTWLWTRSFSRPDTDYGAGLAVDPAGRVFVTGRTRTAPQSQDYDIITIGYTASGDLIAGWGGTYDGPGEGMDRPTGIAVGPDGSVYVGGTSDSGTLSAPNPDYVTLKYTADGTLAWAARYEGPGRGEDSALALAVDPGTGDVVVTGNSDSDPGPSVLRDFATVKYGSEGGTRWVRRYNGFGAGMDSAFSAVIDRTGNVYVTGVSAGDGTGLDFATVKYMSDLEDWSATENGSGNGLDSALAVKTDAAGNVYVTGLSTETGRGTDVATIKYDADGNRLWRSLYNGSANGDDRGNDLVVDSSGNVYVTGTSNETGGGAQITTLKYAPDGRQLWVRFHGVQGTASDTGVAIGLLPSGDVVASGTLASQNIATICYDSAGTVAWVHEYADPGVQFNSCYDLAVSAAGNVYVAGAAFVQGSANDILVLRYDGAGGLTWARRYDDPSHGPEQARALALDARENVYVTGDGMALGVGAGLHPVTVKFDANGNLLWSAITQEIGSASAIALDPAGNVYIAGTATIKFDTDGARQWLKSGGLSSGGALACDAAGDLYVTGFIAELNQADGATVKFDPAGNTVWMAVHRHAGDDMGQAITVDASGNVHVALAGYTGETTGDIITIKYRSGRN